MLCSEASAVHAGIPGEREREKERLKSLSYTIYKSGKQERKISTLLSASGVISSESGIVQVE